MSPDSFFRTPEEELARLNRELAEIKEVMRDVSDRLSQIERHVKRAFGVKESAKVAPGKPKEPESAKPSISPEGALDLFRGLTDLSRDQGSAAVKDRLAAMSIADLKLMAHELGVSFPSKPTRKSLHAGIRGRISESVMLSRNRNVTAPLSEQKKDREGEISKSSVKETEAEKESS
jgi:hypothetical protein